MRILSDALLDSLIQDVLEIIHQVKSCFLPLSELELNTKPAPEKWSIAECLEHLNLYGDYYIPAIRQAMEKNKKLPNSFFSSGWLGEYFTQSMLPKEGGVINKMNAPKDKIPTQSNFTQEVVFRFLKHQEDFLDLLEKARAKDLNKVKVAISISRFIKINLGDIFRFNIAHEQRHLLQAMRVFENSLKKAY